MLGHILDGGAIMIPLMLLSVLAVAIILDRVRAFREATVDTAKLQGAVTSNLVDGRVDDAIRECERFRGPVAAVLMVGLLKFRKLLLRKRPLAEIEANVNKTMGDYAPHVIEALEKRLNLLIMVASVAPLLGMTGTVTGMIRSFQSLAGAGALDATAVSTGIAEALVTTAAGLIIAIPAVVAHNILSKKIDRFVLDIEESATRLIDLITLDYMIEE
ncbi:MAG: MotA/TolQ/ExbB proton channel family protein [Lentisphaerae bacterium]|nr:MotA/TolQ/ExbB proton channel family protein [Lentisphaerota bacterium]